MDQKEPKKRISRASSPASSPLSLSLVVFASKISDIGHVVIAVVHKMCPSSAGGKNSGRQRECSYDIKMIHCWYHDGSAHGTSTRIRPTVSQCQRCRPSVRPRSKSGRNREEGSGGRRSQWKTHFPTNPCIKEFYDAIDRWKTVVTLNWGLTTSTRAATYTYNVRFSLKCKSMFLEGKCPRSLLVFFAVPERVLIAFQVIQSWMTSPPGVKVSLLKTSWNMARIKLRW